MSKKETIYATTSFSGTTAPFEKLVGFPDRDQRALSQTLKYVVEKFTGQERFDLDITWQQLAKTASDRHTRTRDLFARFLVLCECVRSLPVSIQQDFVVGCVLRSAKANVRVIKHCVTGRQVANRTPRVATTRFVVAEVAQISIYIYHTL